MNENNNFVKVAVPPGTRLVTPRAVNCVYDRTPAGEETIGILFRDDQPLYVALPTEAAEALTDTLREVLDHLDYLRAEWHQRNGGNR